MYQISGRHHEGEGHEDVWHHEGEGHTTVWHHEGRRTMNIYGIMRGRPIRVYGIMGEGHKGTVEVEIMAGQKYSAFAIGP